MKGTKKNKIVREKGITLIALVITIVILIILATVTLNVVLGEGGLIQRAQEGKRLTDQAQKDEQDELKGAEEFINGVLAGTTNPPAEVPETVTEGKESGTPFEDTTTITDDLDNPVTVPGGFNIAEDSGTKVEEGIVIEDSNNNQFVWIPVGEYNVSTTINSTGKLTNNLSRRTFTSSGATEIEGVDTVIKNYYYAEDTTLYTSVAKNTIGAFKTSSTTNKGFYIGRYEAGTETERTASNNPLTIPLVQANKYPYIWITRDEAKQQAEAMYSGNEFVTSQLISSYAWDTALNFICQTNSAGYTLATTLNKTYGNIGTYTRTKTGEYEADNYSNIHDLLGNCYELTTEYSSYDDLPCVLRGGNYGSSYEYAAARYNNNASSANFNNSFRLQLYINPEN